MDKAVEVLNKLQERFGRLHIVAIGDSIRFMMACHEYSISSGGFVLEVVQGECITTPHSRWLHGIGHGKVRNDAGELVSVN